MKYCLVLLQHAYYPLQFATVCTFMTLKHTLMRTCITTATQQSNKAKAAAPTSLRAAFGTDGTRNAAHGSDSTASAVRELGFWFPAPTPVTRTLAMLKPGTAETAKEDILSCIAARGFRVVKVSNRSACSICSSCTIQPAAVVAVP
jgi:nucleoside diphosphate kinase